MRDPEVIKLSNTMRYYEIAKKSCQTVEKLAKKREDELKKKSNDSFKIAEYANSVHNEAIIVVVFCTMTLESYINEYGIIHSSRSYFQNHLENLKLISKFTLIPKLNNKQELDTGHQYFADLKWLITLRNDLTHYKMKEKDLRDFDMSSLIKQKDFILEDHALKAIKTVENILNTLEPDFTSIFDRHIEIRLK